MSQVHVCSIVFEIFLQPWLPLGSFYTRLSWGTASTACFWDLELLWNELKASSSSVHSIQFWFVNARMRNCQSRTVAATIKLLCCCSYTNASWQLPPGKSWTVSPKRCEINTCIGHTRLAEKWLLCFCILACLGLIKLHALIDWCEASMKTVSNFWIFSKRRLCLIAVTSWSLLACYVTQVAFQAM